jgi:hypothetical protein
MANHNVINFQGMAGSNTAVSCEAESLVHAPSAFKKREGELSGSWFRLALPLISLAVLACTLPSLGMFRFDKYFSSDRLDVRDVTPYLGDAPLIPKLTPIQVSLPISQSDLIPFANAIVVSPVSEEFPQARSRVLHASRLSTLSGSELDWLDRDQFGRIVRVRFPRGTFTVSRHGVEVMDSPDGDRTEHRDQLLAALADAGVPLSAPIDSAKLNHTVKDLLRTSLNEFHLNQKEISWTAAAYASYLPPQRIWQNRYREEFTFDQLADALIARSLASESCRGMHLVIASTHLLLVDREISILNSDTRNRLESHLAKRVRDAVESQLPDGSWPMWWSSEGFHGRNGAGFTPRPTLTLRVSLTAHILEWFHYLPESLKPPESTAKAGLLWLWAQLQQIPTAQISTDFCPFTHAVRALDLALPSST